MPRRTTLAGVAMALAAAGALAACGADPKPGIVSTLAPPAHTALRDRLGGGPPLFVAGQELDVTLLRRFYGRHGFAPVWATRQAQARSLVDAVLRAGDQGLDPELFHATLLRRRETLPPLDRDMLLSDAFLSYASALARGAVPLERRRADQALTPEPIDVTAVLDDAAASADAGAVIEKLAPATPTYRALREALKKYRSGPLAADRGATNRLRTIVVNLERQRWLPRPLPADRVWVNVAAERLVLYRADRPVFSARVVVGEDIERNQSPEFRATIDASFLNPPWIIPADIAKAEILPKLNRDAEYLTRNRMVLLPGGEVEQLPGPDAGLGLIMFDMPNRFDVYLHDTPDRYIFNRDNRRISHGCIRVQNPLQLAALLMGQPVGAIIQKIAQGLVTGDTTRNNLPVPVPVFVVYQTAAMDADGTLQFYPDFYNRDAEIWRKLQKGTPRLGPALQADNRLPPPRAL
ncbi:MAG: L,D-transpeptidase family protein [Proteobacteria bacterium]|nr:L,D-transpeptidase family protein [Pseudomonadota bacterium]